MTDVWTDRAGKTYYPSLMQEEREVRAVLKREFSASLLNNTKWRELLQPLEAWGVTYDIKFVDVGAPVRGSLSHRTDRFYDSRWGPVPILSVEWIQLHDPEPKVQHLVEALKLPYVATGGAWRVVAHLRNGDPMPPNNSSKPTPLRGAA
ncbi:DUF6678 family protein [Cognatilysobacter bugurensis]|uniref:Uncharacterized protein n=1 Tax=Cognatilysobacter bugurensis TaxID=543356 RepID=A0A918SX54_9GAMM|nr:DUF6678 family protein [Lysobacter bugurensis]GHA76804.1 hypothetical protein GCM10007067_12600 [Lysobacter bugurensis]